MTRLALLVFLLLVWGCGAAPPHRPRPQRITLSEGGKVLREWKCFGRVFWEKHTATVQFQEWHSRRWIAIVSPRGTVIAEPFPADVERGRD